MLWGSIRHQTAGSLKTNSNCSTFLQRLRRMGVCNSLSIFAESILSEFYVQTITESDSDTPAKDTVAASMRAVTN